MLRLRCKKVGGSITEKGPLCEHGKESLLLVVKNEGPIKDRKFFACAEEKENQCNFFKWFKEEPEDLLVCEPADLFSNPPSYKYTVKKTGEMFTSTEKDRKKAYADFLRRDLAETTRSILKKHSMLQGFD